MNKKVSTDSKPMSTDAFKTFPEFSKLTFSDRTEYEKFLRDYPPMWECAFPTLMNWWNALNSCAVSQLNGNLLISYWLPGAEKATGISLVGTHEVDATLCQIFDHLKNTGEPPRLVHVPEFVIGAIHHPELFIYKPERSYDEYILDLSKYYPIEGAVSYRRHRVQRFMAKAGGAEVAIRSLDLSVNDNNELLLHCAQSWPRRPGTVNDIFGLSNDAFVEATDNFDAIGIKNICLYVDDEIHGFLLYSQPADERYIVFSHIFVNSKLPYTYDYAVYAFSKWLVEHGTQYVNVGPDLGVPLVRMLKLALGPVNHFRKYTIEPV